MARKFLIVFGVTALALSASACNTVKGLGEDIKSVGQTGEDAIN